MNSITQISLFDYMDIENLGDLEKFYIFLENVDLEELCKKLENKRGNGRNDYPIRTMLNLIIAMKIFGHRSVESFRRELARNSQLRLACGLSEGKFLHTNERKHLVPPARVFSNFLKILENEKEEIHKIINNQINFMYENLEGFGEEVAIDGKYLDTYANKNNKEKTKDKRSEHDAGHSCKTYYMADGTSKKEWHFGFRAHILCDANYGLPIEYRVTPANTSEGKVLDNMLEEMENTKIDKIKVLLADAGYDSGKRNKDLKEKYNINPLIDNRHMWSKDEQYREIDNQMMAYNQSGEVYYILDDGTYEKMRYLGYDKSSDSLRYEREKTGKKVYRIPLDTDRRIFIPVARDSKKYKKLYKKRTEVERLNGRIDRDYIFNDHFIRGLDKMRLMLDLTFLIMLTFAKVHIKKEEGNIRSLVA